MEWALGDFPGVDDLVEYETRLNHVLPRYPGTRRAAHPSHGDPWWRAPGESILRAARRVPPRAARAKRASRSDV